MDDFTPGIISEARVKKLEDLLPKTKGYFSISHQHGMWHVGRLNYYGSFYEDHLDSDVVSAADGGLPIYGGSAFTVDWETGLDFDSGLYLRFGGEPVRQGSRQESLGWRRRCRVPGAHAVWGSMVASTTHAWVGNF